MAEECSVDRMVKNSELPKIFAGLPSDSIGERLHAEIVDSKSNEGGSIVYRVRWVTYTWSTEENLSGYHNIVQAYWKKKNAIKSKTSGDVKQESKLSHIKREKDHNDNNIGYRSQEDNHGFMDVEGSDDEIVAANVKAMSNQKKFAGESPRTSSRSRRKGNPRKVNVELLEKTDGIHNDDYFNYNEFRVITMDNDGDEDDDASRPAKFRRAASKQAKSGGTSRLRCDFCCITFANEYYYDLHMSSHDPEEEIYLDNNDEYEVWQIAEDDTTISRIERCDTSSEHQQIITIDNNNNNDRIYEKSSHESTNDQNNNITTETVEKVYRNVPQPCEICDKVFIYKKSFRKHKLDCHADTTCTNCWKTYIDKQSLDVHICQLPVKEKKKKSTKVVVSQQQPVIKVIPTMDTSKANPTLQCHLCEKTFKHASDLRKHAVCHSDETPFPCTKCDKKFKRKKNLNSHLERCIGPNKVQLFCSRCPKTFWTQGYLRMHERIHDGTNPYYCKPCDKYFLKKSKLQRHLASDERRKLRAENMNVTKKIPFKCQFCEKVFLGKRNHEMHERIHQGTNPYYCKKCDQYFLKQRSLVQHQKYVHSDKKPFPCMKCEKRFKFSGALNAHFRTHNGVTNGSEKVRCIKCGLTFVSLLSLQEHLKTSNTCTSLSCKLCGQKFLSKKQLTHHTAVAHTNKGPFKCGECTKVYSFKWELVKHQQIHLINNQDDETYEKSELHDNKFSNKSSDYLKEIFDTGKDLSGQLHRSVSEKIKNDMDGYDFEHSIGKENEDRMKSLKSQELDDKDKLKPRVDDILKKKENSSALIHNAVKSDARNEFKEKPKEVSPPSSSTCESEEERSKEKEVIHNMDSDSLDESILPRDSSTLENERKVFSPQSEITSTIIKHTSKHTSKHDYLIDSESNSNSLSPIQPFSMKTSSCSEIEKHKERSEKEEMELSRERSLIFDEDSDSLPGVKPDAIESISSLQSDTMFPSIKESSPSTTLDVSSPQADFAISKGDSDINSLQTANSHRSSQPSPHSFHHTESYVTTQLSPKEVRKEQSTSSDYPSVSDPIQQNEMHFSTSKNGSHYSSSKVEPIHSTNASNSSQVDSQYLSSQYLMQSNDGYPHSQYSSQPDSSSQPNPRYSSSQGIAAGSHQSSSQLIFPQHSTNQYSTSQVAHHATQSTTTLPSTPQLISSRYSSSQPEGSTKTSSIQQGNRPLTSSWQQSKTNYIGSHNSVIHHGGGGVQRQYPLSQYNAATNKQMNHNSYDDRRASPPIQPRSLSSNFDYNFNNNEQKHLSEMSYNKQLDTQKSYQQSTAMQNYNNMMNDDTNESSMFSSNSISPLHPSNRYQSQSNVFLSQNTNNQNSTNKQYNFNSDYREKNLQQYMSSYNALDGYGGLSNYPPPPPYMSNLQNSMNNMNSMDRISDQNYNSTNLFSSIDSQNQNTDMRRMHESSYSN